MRNIGENSPRFYADSQSSCLKIMLYDASLGEVIEDARDSKYIQYRYGLIHRIKVYSIIHSKQIQEKKIFGILINSTNIKFRHEITQRVKSLLKSKGKKCYLFLMSFPFIFQFNDLKTKSLKWPSTTSQKLKCL